MSTFIAAGPRPGGARADEAWRPDYGAGECGTVVVADGDERSRALRGMVLRHAGYVVLEAATGEETIRLAHALRPDAIVLAAVLRGVDGMRALDVLTEHPATAPIPVVVLGSGGPEHERRARAAGCAAWLPVPCPPRRLLDTLRALAERRQAA